MHATASGPKYAVPRGGARLVFPAIDHRFLVEEAILIHKELHRVLVSLFPHHYIILRTILL